MGSLKRISKVQLEACIFDGGFKQTRIWYSSEPNQSCSCRFPDNYLLQKNQILYDICRSFVRSRLARFERHQSVGSKTSCTCALQILFVQGPSKRWPNFYECSWPIRGNNLVPVALYARGGGKFNRPKREGNPRALCARLGSSRLGLHRLLAWLSLIRASKYALHDRSLAFLLILFFVFLLCSSLVSCNSLEYRR